MIKSTTKLQLNRKMKKGKMPIRKLTTNGMKIYRVKEDLYASLNDRIAEIPASTVEENWNTFKSIVYKVFKGKLGNEVIKDLFDGNCM